MATIKVPDGMQITENYKSELVLISVDKAKLVLQDHKDNLTASDAWITPASIFIASVTVLSTTTTRGFIVSADVWTAIYIVVAFISGALLINALYKKIRLHNKTRISHVIDRMRAEEDEQKKYVSYSSTIILDEGKSRHNRQKMRTKAKG